MNAIIDAATALYTNDLIDEYDFLWVYESTRIKGPEFQYWEYEKVQMQLENMTNDESQAEFRFDLADLPLLAEVLGIPNKIVCPNRTVATGMEALCIALKRFAYPYRYNDVIPQFDRSVSELCLITSEVTDHIYNNLAATPSTRRVCQRYSQLWCCSGKLLGFHKWHSKTNLPSRTTSKISI